MTVLLHIEKCLIPKLSKNVDETDVHFEYKTRENELQKHFELVIGGLEYENMRVNLDNSAKLLAAILILNKELLTKGPWYSDMLVDYANRLSAQCECLYGVKPDDFLKIDHIIGDIGTQMIFDECMKSLHMKLTSNEFKKYPSLVEVYSLLIENIQEYNNITVSVKVMPVSLYLIDDYNLDSKRKGLMCCINILKNLKSDAFEGGNYYEVIYASLKKTLLERNTEITRLVLDCLQELLRVTPPDSHFKISATDELFSNILDHIQSESNLHRKAALFSFMKILIQSIGVSCVSKKTFLSAVCYNLEECCNKGVDDILLSPVVLCLEEWVRHCWCVWKLSTGQGVLSALLKVLYTCGDDMVEKVVKLTATLITLCTAEERQKIVSSLQTTQKGGDHFKNRLSLVNKYILVM